MSGLYCKKKPKFKSISEELFMIRNYRKRSKKERNVGHVAFVLEISLMLYFSIYRRLI
jgi:hypothetical protein